MAWPIAVISDIHGNLPALEAVLADIRARGIEDVVCLGDLAYKGPFPGECVERVRALAIPTVRGNTDDDLVRAAARAAPDPHAAWHLERLGGEGLAFLSALPGELRRSALGCAWLFVHATPRDLRDRIAPDDDEEAVWRRIAGVAADAVVMGHIHRPYVRRVRRTLLVNTGAVGAPFDGDPRASYAVLEPGEGEGEPRVRHVRVAYDVEAVLSAARERGFPFDLDDYARMLRTGRP